MTSESVSKDDDTAAGHTVNAPQGPSWKPVARSSTHELVINAIEEQITSGSLTVGDPLPSSERELAAKLQVSRAAVREALRVMESLGVVVSNVGSGKSAGTFIASMPKEALTRFLRLHVALANFSIEEAIETRIQFERSSTALATGRVHDDALAGMNASLAIMDTPGVSLGDLQRRRYRIPCRHRPCLGESAALRSHGGHPRISASPHPRSHFTRSMIRVL